MNLAELTIRAPLNTWVELSFIAKRPDPDDLPPSPAPQALAA